MRDDIRSIFKLRNIPEAMAIAGAGSDFASTGKPLLKMILPPDSYNKLCEICVGKGPVIGLTMGLAIFAVVRALTGEADRIHAESIENRLNRLYEIVQDIQLNQLSSAGASAKFQSWVEMERDADRLSQKEADRMIELIPTYFGDDTANEEAIDAALGPIMDLIGEPEAQRLSLYLLTNFDRLPAELAREFRGNINTQIANSLEGANRTVFSSLDDIMDRLTVKPIVTIPVPEGSYYDDREAKISRLCYSELLVPKIIGRDEELQELNEFRSRDEKFLYWTWFGDGGLGKSRLALEWLYNSLTKGWRGGFLQNGFPPQMERWIPTGPTLFICDYAEASAHLIGPVLRVLQANQSKFPFPVRVLLLDRRYNKDIDFAKFIQGEGDQSTRADYSCVSSPNRRPHERARRLESVSAESFLQMFKVAVWNLSQKQVNASPESLLEVFNSSAFDRRKLRPLYAGIAAFTYVEQTEEGTFNPAKLTDWSTDVLEGFVLTREAKIWQQRVGAGQVEVHALTGACIMGTVPADSATIHGVDRSKVRKMAAHTALDRDYLQPDPLAEALIRMRLKGNTLFGNTPKEIIQAATIELFSKAIESLKVQK